MGHIVVGVDGSPEAAAALRWALGEARLRHATLEAVHAWLFPVVGDVPGAAVDSLARALERAADGLLNQVVDDVAGTDPGVKLERRVVEGAAAAVLIDAAAGADLLVVGSRGRGGFAGLLLGSVAQQCLHHAPCPVVLVRDSGD
ncbi:MAG: universal stress protein [Actinomycetota bacterium]|jgi:nucleotide-binding universal stress UspA family protein